MTFYTTSDNLTAKDQKTNALATATIAAGTGQKILGTIVTYSYSAAPTGGQIVIKDGTTAIMTVNVTGAGEKQLWLDGLESSVSATLSAELAAGGAGIVGNVTLTGRYK